MIGRQPIAEPSEKIARHNDEVRSKLLRLSLLQKFNPSFFSKKYESLRFIQRFIPTFAPTYQGVLLFRG